MAKVSGLEPRFKALGDRVQKIIDEIKTLKETLGDADLSPATEASLLRLEGLTQVADDENPDATVPPPVEPPVEPV